MIAAPFISLLLVATPALAGNRARDDMPKGPTDPGISKYCTFYDEAVNRNYNCDYFSSQWGVDLDDFKAWNPAVGSNCTIVVGHSYCVEFNHGKPIPTTTTAPPTATPSPTQDGLTKDCKVFYLAQAGDTCDKISRKYGGAFSSADFIKWNPAVGADCASLWAKYYYCVGVPGTPTSTSVSTPTTTTLAGPSPTRDGIISSCKAYYKIASGDTCDKVIAKYGTFLLADFVKWNPAVGSDCTGLWLGYYYCVGIPGTPTSPTSTHPTPTSNPNGVETPQPTQPNIIDYCATFVLIKPGEQCGAVASKAGVLLNDFLKWNPSAGADCSGLWANSYACVGALPDFSLATRYHNDCTGDAHNLETFARGNGHCINTDCQVASLQVIPQGACPGGHVRISYWEQPSCTGKWFGYDYASRGQCRGLWSDGWKFKSLFLTCASKESDCVSQRGCIVDAPPNNNIC